MKKIKVDKYIKFNSFHSFETYNDSSNKEILEKIILLSKDQKKISKFSEYKKKIIFQALNDLTNQNDNEENDNDGSYDYDFDDWYNELPPTKKIEIPPGHIIIFYERIVHEVTGGKAKHPMCRLFLGWRLTYGSKSLVGDNLNRYLEQMQHYSEIRILYMLYLYS